MKITPPNYTQTPNDLFDHWLPLLGEGELKVLLVIMRKTFGWHKTHDAISVSQLAKYTGMLEETVISAAKSLQKKGVITREVVGTPGKQQTIYSLVIADNSNNCDPSVKPRGPLGSDGGGSTEAQKKPIPKENDDDDTRETPRSVLSDRKGANTKTVRDLAGRERTVTKDDLQKAAIPLTESTPPATLRRAIDETWTQILSIDYPISDPLKYLQTVLNQKLEQFSRQPKETKWTKNKTQKPSQKQQNYNKNAQDGKRPTSAPSSHRPLSERFPSMKKGETKSASGQPTQPAG